MSDGFFGQLGLTDDKGLFHQVHFLVHQALSHVRTGVPVKIIAVHGGGVGPAPTVDVQPLIKQMDGLGNSSSHGVIYGIPAKRNQGGTGAIINDPKIGDVGHVVVGDRDISSLKSNNGAESNAGSFRRHNLADGVYHGAMLNPATPTNYIQFLPNGGFKIADQFGNSLVTGSGGIVITDCNGNVLNFKSGSIAAPTVNLTSSGGDEAGVGGGDSVTLQNHTHPGTLPPTPGT